MSARLPEAMSIGDACSQAREACRCPTGETAALPMPAKLVRALPDQQGLDLRTEVGTGFARLVFRDGEEVFIQSLRCQTLGPLRTRELTRNADV